MARGINKVILVGNLGNDPEIRYTQNNLAVANITLATSEQWRDKATGEPREKTEWHRVTLFGKLAEVAGEYLRKGSQVYIEGQLKTKKWQDESGQDRYTTSVVVQGYNGVMQMLGSRPNPHAGGWGQPQQPSQPAQSRQQQASRPQQAGYSHQQHSAPPQYNEPPMDFDDDIPFAPVGLQYPALVHCMG